MAYRHRGRGPRRLRTREVRALGLAFVREDRLKIDPVNTIAWIAIAAAALGMLWGLTKAVGWVVSLII